MAVTPPVNTIASPATAELAARLRIEQRTRWRAGDRIPVEAFLREHPQLREDVEGTLDLLYGEFLLREEGGEAPTVTEVVGRFPELAGPFRRQIAFHQAICASASDDLVESTAQTRIAPRQIRPSNDVRPPDSDCSHLRIDPNYAIVREVGRGGVGVVYEARQLTTERTVALKVLSAGLHASPDALARFRAEAALIARLQHPQIVQVFEAGESQGVPYLALEYMAGGSLRERLNGAPQPIAESAELMESLARAVEEAHKSGIIHRDLKPGNVLFRLRDSNRAPHLGGRKDVPKIADFGLAKALPDLTGDRSGSRLTCTGDIIGTPCYMSPEQASGRAHHPGPATDVYSLGAILYELLTGRPPFCSATPLETLRLILTQEPVSPSSLRPGLPLDLETICLKCLQKQPQQRYASAQDLADDLWRFRSDEPIQARPISRIARLARWCRREPALAALGSVVALLLVTLVAGAVIATVRLKEAADERLVEARLAEARAVRLGDQPGKQREGLRLLSQAAAVRATDALRDEAIATLAQFDFEPDALGPEFSEDRHFSIDFDESLRTFARSERAGRIQIGRVQDGQVLFELPEPREHAFLLLSRDGRHLAVRSDFDPRLEIWRLSAQGLRRVLTDLCDSAYGLGPVSFSNSGEQIAVGRPDGKLRVYALSNGALSDGTIEQEWDLDGPAQHLAFHPTQRQLAVAGPRSVRIIDSDTGQTQIDLPDSGGAMRVSWHPSGEILATVDADGAVSLWDPDNRRRRTKLRTEKENGLELDFSHTGALLFVRAWGGRVQAFDPWLGAERFSTRAWPVYAVRFTPGDERWGGALSEGHIRLWRLARRPVCRRLTAVTGFSGAEFPSIDISRSPGEGRRLLAASLSSGVGIWDLVTGAELARLPVPNATGARFGKEALVTNSPRRVERWPLRPIAGPTPGWTIGPPEQLHSPGTDAQLAGNDDLSVLVLGSKDEPLLWRADHPGRVYPLQGHFDARFATVSPGGQMIATGSHTGDRVVFWDSRTGSENSELSLGGSQVAFSPDGAHLATSAGKLALWSMHNLQLQWEVDGALSSPAFTNDGRCVAVEEGTGTVVLRNAVDGSIIAKLTDPGRVRQSRLCFSADRRYLAGVSDDHSLLTVWDLASVAERLREVGIAWNWSLDENPESQRPDNSTPDLTVVASPPFADELLELEKLEENLRSAPNDPLLLTRRGRLLRKLGRFDDAISEFDKVIARAPSIELYLSRSAALVEAGNHRQALADSLSALELLDRDDPREPSACNAAAWRFTMAPVELRDPERGAALARRALRRAPNTASYRNTLGVAMFRLNDWDAALDALRRSLASSSDAAAYDLYFLAMASHRVGDHRTAFDYYHQAVYWHESHKPALDHAARRELAEIRSEAEQVLQVTGEPRNRGGRLRKEPE